MAESSVQTRALAAREWDEKMPVFFQLPLKEEGLCFFPKPTE